MRTFIWGGLGLFAFLGPAFANAQTPEPTPSAAFAPAPAAPTPGVPAPSAPPGPPPPPGYAYGYAYSLIPLPPLKPQFPEDASVSSSPFADVIGASMGWDHRFSASVNVGAQIGAYVMGRVRLTAKIVFLAETVRDDQEDFPGRSSKAPAFFWGGTVGLVAYRSSNFAFSPGVLLMRTNVGDYGSMAGLSLPFEWVLGSGMRIGLEAAAGRAFGGQSAVPGSSSAPLAFENRLAGPAGWLQFQFGFGLNHPSPWAPSLGPAVPIE